MKKSEALQKLDAALKAFAGETNPAAHLARMKLQSARDHVEANWQDVAAPAPAAPANPKS